MMMKKKGEPVRTSVFYDNTKYGKVIKTAGEFTGGKVLVNRAGDTTYNKFHIDATNQVLKIRVDGQDADPYQEIRLDEGDYTIQEMVTQLQNKFDLSGIAVKVSSTGPSYEGGTTQNGNRYSYYGLRLSTVSKGKESNIAFDIAGSTAYDTLFVRRTYTDEGKNMDVEAGSLDYTKASLKGGRSFAASDFPMTLDSTNNSFKLKITEELSSGSTISSNTNVCTITLREGTYTTWNDLIAEIDNQLNGAASPMVIKDKLKVVSENNKIEFYPKDGTTTMTKIEFDSISTPPYDGGYDTLFVGKRTVYDTSSISSYGKRPSVTLDEIQEPLEINSNKNQLNISVNGANRSITVPNGTYTKDQLAQKITDMLQGTTSSYTNTYYGYGKGTTTDKNDSFFNTGKNQQTPIYCNAHGTGEAVQGSTEITEGTQATYTVPVVLENVTTVGESNNELTIAINGNSYTIVLDSRDYTPNQLAQAIHNKLAEQTQEIDMVNVTLDNGRLKFTTARKG